MKRRSAHMPPLSGAPLRALARALARDMAREHHEAERKRSEAACAQPSMQGIRLIASTNAQSTIK
ncbi:MAG: hypothetical protein CML99_15760 [Rhodobiaceae bacterium]|nr:hypothetical protein [Rhodobiaceae bacterium]